MPPVAEGTRRGLVLPMARAHDGALKIFVLAPRRPVAKMDGRSSLTLSKASVFHELLLHPLLSQAVGGSESRRVSLAGVVSPDGGSGGGP